jgi:adenylate cyclase
VGEDVKDDDGEVRRVPMVAEYNSTQYELLSLAVVQTLFDQTKIQAGFAEGESSENANWEWLEMGSGSHALKIPVDADVATLVPYRGKQGNFRYISIADVLHDRVNVTQLKDKIIFARYDSTEFAGNA